MKHGDDVAYTFGSLHDVLRQLGAPRALVDRETALARDFRTLLTNFAKTGYFVTGCLLPENRDREGKRRGKRGREREGKLGIGEIGVGGAMGMCSYVLRPVPIHPKNTPLSRQ